MTKEIPFYEKPDLLATTGSHLYGVSRPDSDMDYRGFVCEPLDILFGFENFEQKEYDDCDKIVYGLKKFFKILQGANTQALEVLFANNYTSKTEVGEKVLANRDLFLSKNYCRSIRGFALSELRKAKAVNLVMKYEDKDSESVFTKLFGKYNLTRLEINSIMDIVFSEREGDPRKEEPSTRNLGERRKKDVDKCGYSVKNAYHAIRLLDQGIELMETGFLTFPRPNAEELIAIRNGNFSIEDIEKRYNDLDEKLKHSYEKSSLPNKVNYDRMVDLYRECVDIKTEREIV